jgi:CheY-like chemotaxis protein
MAQDKIKMKRVKVIKIKASGVIVQFGDSEEAWLPGQELSTKYNPSQALFKQSLCSVGEELEVIEYGREVGGERKLVSHIRVQNDPWDKVKDWKADDVKEMEVYSVTTFRAFGKIEPGIQGYIELAELYDKKRCRFPRTWSDFKTVAVGDIIAGYVDISRTNNERRLVKLDVISYIINLRDISCVLPVLSKIPVEMPLTEELEVYNRRDWFMPELPEVSHMLVVDDSETFSEEISIYLNDFGIKAAAAISKDEAVKFLSDPECPDLDIAIVDVHLTTKNDYTGLEIARSIKEKQPGCRIIITTGDEVGLDKLLESGGDLFISSFLHKPFGLEELTHSISATIREKPRQLKDFFIEEGKNELHDQSPITSETRPLYSILDDLKKRIKAESVILFGIHPVSFRVKIVEECGNVNESIANYMLKLRYSPVKDVAIDRDEIFEKSASSLTSYPKHRWLHNAMQYESCIAFPVEVSHEWMYSLFAFHSDPHTFVENDKYAVKSAAKEIAYILEIKRLQDTWRSETPFILAGKTYGSMAHDLVSTISREFSIPPIFKIIDKKNEIGKDGIEKIKKHLEALLIELRRAKGIVDTFRRMSRSHLEKETEVDVFEAITDVSKNIKIEANALNTEVIAVPVEEWIRRKIRMRRASFEQVIYNLVLNAAQQIFRFRFARDKGLVTIELSEIESGDNDWIRILIHDNGPGIHTHSFEKIFEKGYTTKEDGCGMGLDICRNIIKQARGKIRVLKSVLFVGTTFEILLPLNINKGD